MSNKNEKSIDERLVELEKSTKKEIPTCILRIQKLTYGLIYPAFIGNMIYDLIQFQFGANPDIHNINNTHSKITCLFFILFYILDYVLLHTDLDFLTTTKQKGFIYTFSDIGTSFLFFIGFVAIKYNNESFAIYCLVFIPVIFAIYNWTLKINVAPNLLFGGFSLLVGMYYFIAHNYLEKDYLIFSKHTYLLIVAIVFTTLYFIYNLVCFWYNSKLYTGEKQTK